MADVAGRTPIPLSDRDLTLTQLTPMISEDLLAILRCPLNPSQERLVAQGDHLLCERCRLRFRIQDGFPILVVEEAELPEGCESLGDLPCQTRAPANL